MWWRENVRNFVHDSFQESDPTQPLASLLIIWIWFPQKPTWSSPLNISPIFGIPKNFQNWQKGFLAFKNVELWARTCNLGEYSTFSSPNFTIGPWTDFSFSASLDFSHLEPFFLIENKKTNQGLNKQESQRG